MPFSFKVWNQARDGATMGIRVADVDELDQLAAACTEPDMDGNWDSLQDYLDAAATATQPPIPYGRLVDVVWLLDTPFGEQRHCQNRRFKVLRTGEERASGGFPSQAYCILQPSWTADLLLCDKNPITVEYIPGDSVDVIVVMPH